MFSRVPGIKGEKSGLLQHLQIFDTNPGYKSFGKKFLRKNFHEKAKNLFGKHSVEKFPWKIKQKLFVYKHSVEKFPSRIKTFGKNS